LESFTFLAKPKDCEAIMSLVSAISQRLPLLAFVTPVDLQGLNLFGHCAISMKCRGFPVGLLHE
jgi:hypothetical protein